MVYQTIYDTSMVPFDYAAAGALLVVAAAAIAFSMYRLTPANSSFFGFIHTVKAVTIGGLGFGIIALIGLSWLDNHSMQAYAARAEDAQQIEGIVQDH